jgi:hypothetical protein
VKDNLARLMKLYEVVRHCEVTIRDVAFKLSDLAQDLDYVREELEQKSDEERYYQNG